MIKQGKVSVETQIKSVTPYEPLPEPPGTLREPPKG